MQRISTLLLAGACAVALARLASAQAAPEMSLTRLDCGTSAAPTAVNQRFSDTYAYGDLKLQFVFSCYLIKHGNQPRDGREPDQSAIGETTPSQHRAIGRGDLRAGPGGNLSNSALGRSQLAEQLLD